MFKFSKKFFSLIMAILMLSMTAIGVNAEKLITGTTDLLIVIGIIDPSPEEELMPMAASGCFYESEHAAMRAAKQSVNIPLSANPDNIVTKWVKGENEQYYESVTYIYGNKFIRHDSQGHWFNDGPVARHYNSGTINEGSYVSSGVHFFY